MARGPPPPPPPLPEQVWGLGRRPEPHRGSLSLTINRRLRALNHRGGPQPADPAAVMAEAGGVAAFHQSEPTGHPADLMGYNYTSFDTIYGKHL